MRPTLIQLPISHFCHKVQWGLDQAGVEFELANVWFRDMVDFTDINAEGTVPVLVIRGKRICGSQNIMKWAHAQNPEAGLYPSPAVEMWETWADKTIGPLAQRDAYRTLYNNPTWFGRNPALWAAAMGAKGLILNILKLYKAKRYYERDDAKRAEYFKTILDQIGDKDFLFGDAPTAADHATAALLRPIQKIRKGPIGTTPGLRELVPYVERVKRNPKPAKKRRLSDQRRAAFANLPEA